MTGAVDGQASVDFFDRMVKKLCERNLLGAGNRRLVILDKASIHLAKSTAGAMFDRHAEIVHIYQLPPWSPFLDPCEELFSQWEYRFSWLLSQRLPSFLGNLGELIHVARAQMTSQQLLGFFSYTISFFPDCSARVPITTAAILDRMHRGDEEAVALDHVLTAMGLDPHELHRRFGDSTEARNGRVRELQETTTAAADSPDYSRFRPVVFLINDQAVHDCGSSSLEEVFVYRANMMKNQTRLQAVAATRRRHNLCL